MSAIAGLEAEMERIVREVTAQMQHRGPLKAGQAQWRMMLTGLQDTTDDLRNKSREIAGEWLDEAGDLYAQRMLHSGASVEPWAQRLQSAQIPIKLGELSQDIVAKTSAVNALKRQFDVLKAQFQAATRLDEAQAILNQMQALVVQAQEQYTLLGEHFQQVGQAIINSTSGTPWDGPQGAGSAPTGPATTSTSPTGGPAAAPEGSPAAGPGGSPAAGPGGSPAVAPAGSPAGSPAGGPAAGGAPSGAAGGASAGAPVAGGGPAPTLSGDPVTAAPSPVVPPSAVPPSASTPPSLSASAFPASTPGSSGGVPYIAPAPLGALGAGPARATPVSGGTGQAATPGAAPVPPGTVGAGGTGGAGGAGSGAGRAGMGRMGVPPPMMPPRGGGGSGTGGVPMPGDDDPRYRDRSPRSVPGVPPRLRGRSGRLDAPPEFLGTGAGQAAQRDADTETEAAQPLVEELWQVEEQPPVVEPPKIRRGLR